MHDLQPDETLLRAVPAEGRRASRAWRLLAVPALFLAFAYAIPMAHVVGDAWDGPAWKWMRLPAVRHVVVVTLEQAALSTALAMAAAVPLAWLHHTRRVPGGRTQRALHAMPFVMPVFVVVYGLQTLLSGGGWVAQATGRDVQSTLGPLVFVALANAYYNYGFAAGLLHAAFERRPRHLEQTARTLGATPAAAFGRTTLRLLAPAVASTALLVFLFCFASFGIVLFLGQGRVQTLETLLYDQANGGAAPEPHRAAAIAVTQLVIHVTLLWATLRLARPTIPSQPAHTPPPATRTATLVSWALTFVALLPILAMMSGSLQVGGHWNLSAWRAVLDPNDPNHRSDFDLGGAVGLSLVYAVASVTLSLVLTTLLAYGSRHLGPRARRAAEALTTLPMATSSLVLGVGLLLAYGARGPIDLRGTRTAIILAHTLVAFPFTTRVLLPAIHSHDTRLDDAARTLGAPPGDVARRVHWPVLRPVVVRAAAFAAALSLADYGASVLLMPSTNRGLSVWIGAIDAPFHPLAHAQALVLTAILALMVGAAYALLERAGAKEARA